MPSSTCLLLPSPLGVGVGGNQCPVMPSTRGRSRVWALWPWDCHPPSLGFSFSILWKPVLCLVKLGLCGMSAQRQWDIRIMVLLIKECLLTVVPFKPPIKSLALSSFSVQVGERRPSEVDSLLKAMEFVSGQRDWNPECTCSITAHTAVRWRHRYPADR